MEVLERVTVPLVMVDRDCRPRCRRAACLPTTARACARRVEHLVDLGHRRIGLVVGQTIRPTTERVAALEEVFAARGLPPTYRVLRGESMGASWGEEATRQLLDDPEPPTAIIAGGNQLLIGALRVVAERGVEIGPRLSLVGCDDAAITELYRPPIATGAPRQPPHGRVARSSLRRPPGRRGRRAGPAES